MRVAIIGGDRRMLYAAEAFMNDNDTVRIAGFEKTEPFGELRSESIRNAAAGADIAVLPVRALSGSKLNAPFSAEEVRVDQIGESCGNIRVFGGGVGELRPYLTGGLYDYTAREEFCIANAVLTAEGAVGVAIRESDDAIFGSCVLVLGYGRIGRILARYLRGLGAEVTVAARSEEARAWVTGEGMRAEDYRLRHLSRYRFIFNTVPAPVLLRDHLIQTARGALIIDLASAPGGVDHAAAQALGLRCIHALALPGKTAPADAGRIIKDTIKTILKEENGG